MKLIGTIMLAAMIMPAKVEIEPVAAGVFFVEAWNSQEGVIYKTQTKSHKVMFNMEHILTAEEVKNGTVINVEQGASARQYFIKMSFDKVMKGIIGTYRRQQ